MKFIFSYLKKYTKLVICVLGIKFAATVFELVIPYILEHIIDEIVPQNAVHKVVFWGIVMILVSFLVRFLNMTANRLAVRVAQRNTYDIRRDLFWKSINLSGSQVDYFGLPSLTSRMTSDSYNLQNFTRMIQTMGIRAPIMLLGGIGITMTMDMGLAMILCIMAPILVVIVVLVSKRGIPLYSKVQQSVDDIVRVMRENITGIRVVKALSKEDYEQRRFTKVNEKMTKTDLKAGITMSLPGPIMTLALNIGLVLVVVIGAQRVDAGVTKPGVILAFLTYFNMVLMGVMGLNRIFMQMSKANASANRISTVIYQKEDLVPIPEEDAAKTDKSEFIIFDHVNFNYNSKDTAPMKPTTVENSLNEREKCLSDISFSIPKGHSLGIIGATGCGKTTIINLLMRFYEVVDGHVFVDGKDVRTYEKDQLHRMFGVVFQNDVIIADTIKENISFGRQITIEDISNAVMDARAQEFIGEYEDTYDHKAVIHGANFSGGQRQRILIARALAAKPQILVLDDSSSALDYKTDAALRKAILEHHSDATTIIVAQRISSIMNLDDIIVMEEGKIIGHGTHEELLENCSTYSDIYQTQMGE